MAYFSVSEAIEEIMDGMVFVKSGLKRDLINYSALARMIKPLVDKKMNSDVSLDTIIMAIRRNAESLSDDVLSKQLYACISDCKIAMQTDMFCVHFKRTKDLFKKIIEIEFTLDYSIGERMYVTQRTDEITVVCTSSYLQQLLDLVKDDPSMVIERREKLALATVQFNYSGVYTPGLLHFFTSNFDRLGVNLFGCFSSFSKISFLFDEKDAPLVFEGLSKTIKEAQSIATII